MDKCELFSSCKKGDSQRIRYLVEKKDVDLNVRDKWDGTPLYYACLCGHYEVVLYLLQNGARCDSDTFDGERCLYGALTRKIKNLLRNFKVVTSKTMRRDNYSEYFRRAFETSELYDVCFMVQGEKLTAHCSILAARNKHFFNMLKTKWKEKDGNDLVIYMDEFSISPFAFKSLLQYIYTGILNLNLKDVDTFLPFVKCFGFKNLVTDVEKTFMKRNKPTTLSVESKSNADLSNDFHKLFLSALPQELNKEIYSEFYGSEFADLYILVEDLVFLCHKVFICGRCDYLKALLIDHFSEIKEINELNIQIVKLKNIESHTFMHILQYIYTDTVQLSTDVVLDVLSSADLFILPGLKKICASVIRENLSDDNVVEMIQIARLYGLPRLEAQCTEYMAVHLEKVISQGHFKSLVLADANEIKERQETDTITVIDDIRYHIESSTHVSHSCKKLLLIENLLQSLELDA